MTRRKTLDLTHARSRFDLSVKHQPSTINMKNTTNPRFVWLIGAIAETYPDLAAVELPGTVLYDRQERCPVVTIASGYGNAICLETTDSAATHPFTTLEAWFNHLGPGALDSEGIPDTKPPFDVPVLTLFRFETRVAGHNEPMVDWYDAVDEIAARALHDEDCHRYGIPVEKMTVTVRPATEKELETFGKA